MSKPANGAARNQMSEFERQCYDWGWQDNENRIIKLLEDNIFNSYELEMRVVDFDTAIALIKVESNLFFGGSETAVLEGEAE